MDVTVANQKKKDRLTGKLRHKKTLMTAPVTVWISIDRVHVAVLKMPLAQLDLDVLTILLVNNSLIRTSYFCMDLLINLWKYVH